MMSRQQNFMVPVFVLCSILIHQRIGAQDPGVVRLDLDTAIRRALAENPELQAKRAALGRFEARLVDAELLFQTNPTLALYPAYRNRRFSAPTGRNVADMEVKILQEFEIGGQPGHRRTAAQKDVSRAALDVQAAERALEAEVSGAFNSLLAAQQKIAIQRELLSAYQTLLESGLRRFERKDISTIDLDTLRLDRDRSKTDVSDTENARVLAENRLRLLLGARGTERIIALGNLLNWKTQANGGGTPTLAELQSCALQNRPEVRSAMQAIEMREAERELALAERVPNLSAGPFYRLDDQDQVIGAELIIPLPVFNRNEADITRARTNLNVAKLDLRARELSIETGVRRAYEQLQIAKMRLAEHSGSSDEELDRSTALIQKAYHAGELSIFDLSIALERIFEKRVRMLQDALRYRQAKVQLAAQLGGPCGESTTSYINNVPSPPEGGRQDESGNQS